MREVLGELLWTARHNADGVRSDGNPEYLHRLRVAVRGTRVMLPRAEELYAAPIIGRLRVELRWLGGATNQARDLDVLAIEMREYKTWLDGDVANDLRPFDALIARRAQQATDVVRDTLVAPRVREAFMAWEALVRSPGSPTGKARRSAKKVAREWLRRRHRVALRSAKRLRRSTDGAGIHPLRIALKKLRYTLDFYAPLFAGKPTRKALDRVKQGQDLLGAANDAAVHRALVGSLADELHRYHLAGPATLLAAGELRHALRAFERERHSGAVRWTRDFLADAKKFGRAL